MVLSLSLLDNYSSTPAVKLLEKTQDEVLELVRDNYHNSDTGTPHTIALIRHLLVFCGGRDDAAQHEINLEFTSAGNASFYGSLVDVSGSNCIGSFESHAILQAISLSKAVADSAIRGLDIDTLASKLVAALPIGFSREHLV